MLTGKQSVLFTLIPAVQAYKMFLQWWDANQQTNRPHGFAFSKVSGGTIRDMKIWKVLSSVSYSSF